MKKIILPLVTLILVLTIFQFWQQKKQSNENIPTSTKVDATEFELSSEVYYSCDSGKQIKADYYKNTVFTKESDEIPFPNGKAELVLSDGRRMTLPQTISESGIRYASEDESIVFWNKGENTFIIENNKETYNNCTERVWTLRNKYIEKAIRNFLLSQKEPSWKNETGSNNLCMFQNLVPGKELFPLYLWARCGEYKKENGQIKELNGTSIPIKIDYPKELSYYDLSKFSISIPTDGSLYEEDVKRIFSQEIWNRLRFESEPLNEQIKQETLKYSK